IGENGTLRFKTDNAPLFSFALKEFAAEGWAIGRCDSDSPPDAVMTEYEEKFRALGVPIGALTARPQGGVLGGNIQ
ncbi:MAG: hypothetical protein LBR72_08360, partial [Oscillospiraceae bacterium]|nr:hypothetical protein [Oscillospiraceae bacterium]